MCIITAVCTFMYLDSLHFRQVHLIQYVDWDSFSPECIIICQWNTNLQTLFLTWRYITFVVLYSSIRCIQHNNNNHINVTMKTARIGINESHAVHESRTTFLAVLELWVLGAAPEPPPHFNSIKHDKLETFKLGSIDLITFTHTREHFNAIKHW